MKMLDSIRLLSILISLFNFIKGNEKVKTLNKNDHSLLFPLKVSDTTTSLCINLTDKYISNQLYGIYFDLIISNEIFDTNNKLRYKNNINKQKGQYLSLSLSLNTGNNSILLYNNQKINQNRVKIFSSVIINDTNLSLCLDLNTYLKNYAWNYRSFNKIISVDSITVFPLKKTDSTVDNENSIQSHHYNVLMKFFLEKMDVFNYKSEISLLLTTEFSKRNYNENILDWLNYNFILTTLVFGTFQLIMLLVCYKKVIV